MNYKIGKLAIVPWLSLGMYRGVKKYQYDNLGKKSKISM